MRLVALVLALCLAASAAAAEPTVSPEAKRHVELGVEHYNAGRYADASREFELAYRLSNRPALLFNIARAEAKLGHEESAIAFLRRYLEERPNAPDAPAVLAEIEAHEKALVEASAKNKAETAAKEAEVTAARAQIAAAEAQQKVAEATEAAAQLEKKRLAGEEDARRRQKEEQNGARKSGIALTVLGPVLVIVGGGLGGAAVATAKTVEGKGGDFASCCIDLQRRGQSLTSAGIAFDVIGAAVSVAGISLLAASFRHDKTQVWLTPGPGALAVGGRF